MLEAFVLVRVQPGRLDETSNSMKTIQEEIAKIEGIKEIKIVFGRYDLVLRIEVGTTPELGNLIANRIRNVSGVAETETLIIGF
jgi:Lrp/AsnC family leucine-responsive transcriptional regulator